METVALIALLALIVFIFGWYADSGSESYSSGSYETTTSIHYSTIKKE